VSNRKQLKIFVLKTPRAADSPISFGRLLIILQPPRSGRDFLTRWVAGQEKGVSNALAGLLGPPRAARAQGRLIEGIFARSSPPDRRLFSVPDESQSEIGMSRASAAW